MHAQHALDWLTNATHALLRLYKAIVVHHINLQPVCATLLSLAVTKEVEYSNT